MAAATPVWQGSLGMGETFDSPEIITDATKQTIIRKWEGPYATVEAAEPTMGQTYSDLPGEVIVVGSGVKKQAGGKGTLTVTFETPYETTDECEWVEVDKPLMANPRYWCAALGDPSDGVKSLNLLDRGMLQQWEQEDDPSFKLAFQFKVMQQSSTTTIVAGGNTATAVQTAQTIQGYAGQFNIYQLGSNAQDYATKRLKGEEIYRIYAPVIRETSESFDPPSATPCGLIENPPDDASDVTPTGYQWQRSAKRVVRTGPYGKYRLQAEWQGADFIDPDIYPMAS
jgi:hypothetical protein